MTVNDMRRAINQIKLSDSVKKQIYNNCNRAPSNKYSKRLIMCSVVALIILSVTLSNLFNKNLSFDFSIKVYAIEHQNEYYEYKLADMSSFIIDESNYYIITSQNVILESFEVNLIDDNIKDIKYTINNGEFFEYQQLNDAIYEKSVHELIDKNYVFVYKNNQYFLFDDCKKSNFSSSYFSKNNKGNEDFIVKRIGNTYIKNSDSKVFLGVPLEDKEIKDCIVNMDISFNDGKRMSKSILIKQEYLLDNNIKIDFIICD
ncbi:MAG: hypothetical protein E7568_00025 [Ruminococcaceae bacterium]|nr:hypothetical protein [Oscillospiraceae bacterium]